MKRVDKVDLKNILDNTPIKVWESLRGKSIFITGATGFFGKWLLESFLFVNKELELNARVCALSRNPENFFIDFPFYKTESSIKFITGDIQDFEYPSEEFQFIIHAATDADAKLNNEDPLLMLETITNGALHILNFAKSQPRLEGFLFTSSGAIYGKQPENVTHISEVDAFPIDINNVTSAYTEGKRVAELYCAIYHKHYKIPIKIARCFAFVGPYLPLGKHFALGNFISDRLNNRDIVIKGDGTPFRSYLYSSDLMIWLWQILVQGNCNDPYNVGSDQDFNLTEIANKVINIDNSKLCVKVLGTRNPLNPVERYVPSIEKVNNQLGLKVYISLEEAINKTYNFYKNYE